MNNSYAPPPANLAWAYFLDIDGTLIDIALTPDAVHVDTDLLGLIARLHAASGGAVALVSGRTISDIESRLGSLRLPMAGQHGLERQDGAGNLQIRAAPSADSKQAIKTALLELVACHPGLLLEDKGLTLALHYRLAPQLAAYVHRLMNRLARLGDGRLEVQRGKCVAEIKPTGFDKGTAIGEFLAEPPFKARCPVFIGDDLNDEHGFAEVNRMRGVSIKVGKGPSCARFRLSDVAAVRRWLARALTPEAAIAHPAGPYDFLPVD